MNLTDLRLIYERGSCVDEQNADLVTGISLLCQRDPRVCELNASPEISRLETSECGSHFVRLASES